MYKTFQLGKKSRDQIFFCLATVQIRAEKKKCVERNCLRTVVITLGRRSVLHPARPNQSATKPAIITKIPPDRPMSYFIAVMAQYHRVDL